MRQYTRDWPHYREYPRTEWTVLRCEDGTTAEGRTSLDASDAARLPRALALDAVFETPVLRLVGRRLVRVRA